MSKYLTILLVGCTTVGSHAAASLFKKNFQNHSYVIWEGFYRGGILHDPDCSCHNAGIGYTQSVASSLMAFDWTEHESDNEPGCGYREGAAAAEDADCVEDYE